MKDEKRKKKHVVQKPFLGYCPNYIVNFFFFFFVLQENECIVKEQLFGCEMGCRKKNRIAMH